MSGETAPVMKLKALVCERSSTSTMLSMFRRRLGSCPGYSIKLRSESSDGDHRAYIYLRLSEALASGDVARDTLYIVLEVVPPEDNITALRAVTCVEKAIKDARITLREANGRVREEFHRLHRVEPERRQVSQNRALLAKNPQKSVDSVSSGPRKAGIPRRTRKGSCPPQ